LQNDRLITISTAGSRKAAQWPPSTLLWSELVAKLQMPIRGKETLADYLSYKKGQQDDLKDVGGFVAGTLDGNRRKASAVTGRDVLTLDLDNIPAGTTQDVLRRVDGLGCGYCIYSTRKHCEAAPRLRVLLPLDRTVNADEYEPIARKTASLIGIELCDKTTFEASRLMYWPSCCSDSTYVYTYGDKGFLYADGVLGMYNDWRNAAEWPQVPGVQEDFHRLLKKQEDPTAKSGIVGIFCRTYDIYRAMDEFIPGEYIPTDIPDRYTYAGGSTTGGAIIYDNGLFLYSHHATDPCSGKLVNAFDLVRLHKFGDKDDNAKPDTPANKLPSFVAMCEFAKNLEEVEKIIKIERYEQAKASFSDNDIADEESFKTLSGYEDAQISIEIMRCAIRAFGYGIKLNTITNRAEISGLPIQYSQNNAVNILPVILLDSLNKAEIRGCTKPKIEDCLFVIADENRYNPVEQMLLSNCWDGTDRLPDIYSILYLSEDLYKTYVRKWLIQCVAMALNSYEKPMGADGVLVLQGNQGLGKTEFFRKLALKPQWFVEGATLNTNNKDSLMKTTQCWICELGELDSTTKRRQPALKAHITAAFDVIRTPYAREATITPRRTSYCGTVNPDKFLCDETGNRRYWTIPVENIDLERLSNISADWVIQLWLQAFSLYTSNPNSFRLTKQEQTLLAAKNSAFDSYLTAEVEMRDILNFEIPIENWSWCSATDIASRLCNKFSAENIGKVISKLIKEQPTIKKKKRSSGYVYLLPPLYPNTTDSACTN
jgi:predicted P-loop ATPase